MAVDSKESLFSKIPVEDIRKFFRSLVRHDPWRKLIALFFAILT